MSEEKNETHEPAQQQEQHGIRGNDEKYLANLKEGIEREREKEATGQPNARALLDDELARYERDKTDPPRRLNAGNLAAIFGMSQAAVRRLIEEKRLKTEGKEVIYRIRQSEIDRYKAELEYRRGKRFIIVEGETYATTPNVTFSDEIAAHVKGKIVGEGFVAYELDRVLTTEENIFFIQQGIRLLSARAFHDYYNRYRELQQT